MIKKIAILTSGGDAPGMNAAIRAVTRAALHYKLEVYGVYEGYKGLVEDQLVPFNARSVSDIINRGGTILGTARLPEFRELAVREKAAANLKSRGIDALIVIGGDGTYKGAMLLNQLGINCIGLPGTIDNDISGTDYTIGFDTALNTIVENIDKIRDTSSSHQRCSIIEVMGRHCGDLALYAGLSSAADYIITPEIPFKKEDLFANLKSIREGSKKRAIVVMTEKVTDPYQLAKEVEAATGFETRATVLGHIQRGGAPSAADRVLASRMGKFAVDLLMEGWSSRCVCISNNHITHLDFNDALNTPHQASSSIFDDAKAIR